MCEGPGQPVSVLGALGLLDRALNCLAAADTAALPAAAQAEALLALACYLTCCARSPAFLRRLPDVGAATA